MTDEELVKWLRNEHRKYVAGTTVTTTGYSQAADRIEALQADKAKLRETLKQIEASTYPRPLGKSWRMDLSSSKHDRCIHDEWMYDTCEGCLDDFIRKALQETGQ